METFRVSYKTDDFQNPMYARVYWSGAAASQRRPIAVVYHAGGLVGGSSEFVPKPQIEYLCSKSFLVVLPNYRLVPQVTGKLAFADCVAALEWTTSDLPELLESGHGIKVDTNRVVAMGHSSGGSIALYLASFKPLKAVTAFYPFIFVADSTTNAHKPTDMFPFGTAKEFSPSNEDWAEIKPSKHQLSETPLATPDAPLDEAELSPRVKWMLQVFKAGKWLSSVQPDGDFAAIDPMTMLHARWPPTMIIQGENDYVPGRSLELAQRAEKEMRDAGMSEVQVEILAGAGHLFDHVPAVGTKDLGPKWQAVLRGLEWLCNHV